MYCPCYREKTEEVEQEVSVGKKMPLVKYWWLTKENVNDYLGKRSGNRAR